MKTDCGRAMVDSALKALEDGIIGNDQAAANSMQAFVNAVEAQRGKKISNSEAGCLKGVALGILDTL